MKRKKSTPRRLDQCRELLIENPREHRGNWKAFFGNDHPLHIEIGCGKGAFISQLARLHPEINYLAIERVPECVVLAAEKIDPAECPNLRFYLGAADDLTEIFAPGEVERIYLNFSDPWPKTRYAKRRLTHPLFLARYRAVLAPGGGIHFKTDNRPLFDFSLRQLEQDGWKLEQVTFDLHHSDFQGNIMTEYETRFASMGAPIHRLEAYPLPREVNES
ncbi:MAG: tRNA (guanosine(46)-N7)-methyltransferase TrmB [Eubacteriales bacterium]